MEKKSFRKFGRIGLTFTFAALLSLGSCDKIGKSAEKAEGTPEIKESATPDLAFNDLRGPVQYVTLNNDWNGDGGYEADQYFYTEDGKWLNIPKWQGDEKKSFNSYDGDKYEKDANGYVVMIREAYSGDEGDGGGPTTTSIEWENGKMTAKHLKSNYSDGEYWNYSSSDTEYTYDDKGLLIKEVTKSNYSSNWGSNESSETETYSYVDFDKYGNWTKRIVNSKSEYDQGKPYTSTYTQTREITYYK